ncbi:hypothetical protein ZIOFF_062149 [Zingiber officinale]|uniref:RING-type E3 ubiquitin transferase n=1 Tax=Zingiber officinale TaxID=94328 RepID=A0A8J5K970_ZINOF|nr:hypothetical protein ZIOFF_062149 [Zingiber officinale]
MPTVLMASPSLLLVSATKFFSSHNGSLRLSFALHALRRRRTRGCGGESSRYFPPPPRTALPLPPPSSRTPHCRFRRPLHFHYQAGIRPVNNNSMAFLLTVLVLFMILNSHQMSPNFLIWLLLVVFLMVTSLRMYATCQQLQAEAHAHAAAASGLLGHTELRLHVPPSIALATRGRLQSLRLQLALLDREFDDLDYDALRALDSDNPPDVPSMTEEEINSLPAHKYKFHANCIDPWLRQQGTCPVCKHKVNSAWHMTGEDATDMV